jgi:LysM repeat protein
VIIHVKGGAMPRTLPHNSHLKLIPALVLVLALWTGISSAASGSPGRYEVRKGDNLGLIAYRFGVTVGELRSTNNLTTDVLQIDQKLRIERPFHRPADIKWEPPCRRHGDVLRHFGPYKKKGIIMPSTGTDVTCALGTTVSSPAHGVVRHIGHMDGLGTLIIIEHGEGYASVFSPLDPGAVAVEVGTAVLRGDHIGRTGPPPEKDTPPFLHVELRRNDKAIKPDRLLE